MTTTKVTLSTGHEIRTTRHNTHAYGTNYSSIMFAPDSARIIASTDLCAYFDYCPGEVLRLETDKLLESAGVSLPDNLSEFESSEFECSCPCDCGDCLDCEVAEIG